MSGEAAMDRINPVESMWEKQDVNENTLLTKIQC